MDNIFADDIFKHIFFNENPWIAIKIPLKFVPKGPNNNILELVQIMAWHWPGDKPLSELVMVSLLTHICIDLSELINKGNIMLKGPWKMLTPAQKYFMLVIASVSFI